MYTCDRCISVLLIAVDTALIGMAVSSRRPFAFDLMAVDIQLHRAGDIQLCQRLFCFTDRGWNTAKVGTAVSFRSAFALGFDCC